jgi:hypothetical protein
MATVSETLHKLKIKNAFVQPAYQSIERSLFLKKACIPSTRTLIVKGFIVSRVYIQQVKSSQVKSRIFYSKIMEKSFVTGEYTNKKQ